MPTIFGTNADEVIRGTARADSIFGLLGRDTIYGGAGDDTLDGGGHADNLFGGAGFDLATYSANTTPVWADLRIGTVRFPGQPWAAERLVGIEAVEGGSAGDTLIGDGRANLLIGNGGSDHLIGGVGADLLNGGLGHDTLSGGIGNDTMLGAAGNDRFDVQNYRVTADGVAHVDPGADVLNGGTGRDTVVVSSPVIDNPDDPTQPFLGYTTARINLNLGTLRLNDDAHRSTLISIENVETGSGDDAVNGSAAANYISVGDGHNVVYAGGGNDTIVGGAYTYDQAGGETLNGGAGDDVIYGNGSRFYDFHLQATIGLDYLVGGEGNDSLYGGQGHQTMSGGAGEDLFSFYADGVYDENQGDYVSADSEIVDFESGDRIRFDSPYLNGNHFEFVGESQPEDLDQYEVGYYHDGDDTIVVAHMQPYNGEDEYLEITLTGYQGDLTADNFDLG